MGETLALILVIFAAMSFVVALIHRTVTLIKAMNKKK